MAETDLSEVVIVDEPLTSSNYENWKVYMKNYLSNLNLWGIVNGTESKPDEVNEYNTWMTRNEMALSAIKTSCGPKMVPHLHGVDSAKEAWDQLASMQSPEITQETSVALEIQDDDDDAVPETQVFTCQKSPNRNVSSNSSFGEQMIPLDLYDEDTSDAVSEVEESFADAVIRLQKTVRDRNSGWCDDKPDYIRFRPLYKALTKGDWRTAKEIIEDHPEGLRANITSRGDTALHAAVVSGKLSTVKALLKLLPPEALEAKSSSGDAPIFLSAADGSTEIAKVMVKKNNRVLRIKNQHGFIPLVISILYEKEEMFCYLYSVTPMEELDPEKSKNGASFLLGAINAEMFDVALEALELYPKLAISKDKFGIPAIFLLALKSYIFPSGSRFGFWQRCMYSSCLCVIPGVKDLQEKKIKHVQVLELLKVICSAIGHMTDEELKNGKVYDSMLVAATNGNIEVFMELFNANPSLLYTSTTASRKTLYHQAVMSRQENIFNFISSMGQRDIRATHKDNSDNNLLHYAGMLPLSSLLDRISGAALQMQREIQWFQEVEKIVQPKYKESLNKDGETPAEVFTEQHKALKKDGEVWMKETANACMLVSALIATVMFAAAFTVPGGNDQSTGTPFFLKTPAFTIFIVSDAISLFASCTAILMFFSILTARYAEQDFLKSLPQRLIIGLAALFISIAAMMAAFGATLVIVLHNSITWAYIPVTLLASVPVVLFGLLLFPLFLDIVLSTYGTGIFTWHKVYLNNNE
ncbi:hypothetical protein MKW98_020882 [Papaver atlanticum]|uniref:PGG domain-containing protein n=1 Tax=Papaver atlanticum TaxID=357466 RepID=A0AAD4TG09_9MAGN|nr:hypothetical protein MKW98_020882 [Papaver atlanticum]